MNTLERKLERLLANRSAHLERRPVRSIARSLGRLSVRWLDRRYAFRKKAVRRLGACSGYDEKMAERLLDSLFGELTEKKLLQLLRSEFRDYRVLDDFRRDPVTGQKWHARGPRLIAHVFSGNVPNPAVQSLVFGMLLKSANIAKASSRDEGIADIYLGSLKRSDAKLASTNLLLPSGDKAGLRQALSSAELVAAYGSDATMQDIRKNLNSRQAFFPYGHRTSFSIFTRGVLTRKNAPVLARKAAMDLWLTDQKGCLSPAALFAQKGGAVSPQEFSGLVAKALSRHARPKRASLPGSLVSWRAAYGEIFQRLKRRPAQLFRGAGWSVFYDEKMEYPIEGEVLVRVKGFDDVRAVRTALRPLRGYFQCAALEAGAGEKKNILRVLMPLSIPRLCRAGRMQLPPLTWHHDGKSNLASWVSWTDLEER